MSGPVPVQIGPKPVAAADKQVEADDPYELVGVAVPVAPGVDADRALALAFVEEFALSGWRPARIVGLFSAPASGKAHEIWQRRGAALVDDVIRQVFGAPPPTDTGEG
jgi:hypothetical protein